MALWACTACTAAYAVGLPCCPQCGSTDHQEDSMPKITRAGASYEPGRGPASQPAATAEQDAPPSPAGDDQETTPPADAPAVAGTGAEPEPEPTVTAPARAQPKKAADA